MLRIFLAILALTLPASAEQVEQRFDLYLGGLRAAEVDLAYKIGAERFEGRTELRTVGLAAIFFDGFFRIRAEGEVTGQELKPGLFDAQSAFEDDRQNVVVAYKNGRPRVTLADPPFRPRPWEISAEAQLGTLDPFSAALTILRPVPVSRMCSRTIDIFDGRRRGRVTLDAPRKVRGEMRCDGRYKRVAGFSPKSMKRDDLAFTAIFQVVDGEAYLRQITAPTPLGLAVATLRD